MATPLEKDIEKSLTRMVGKHGGLCLKWVCPGWAGVPDRILLLPGGHVMFVELKRSVRLNGSAMQVWWARKLRGLGFIHFWVKSHEDVKALEKSIMDRICPPREVHWSRPGPCPITAEQFEAIYDEEEA